jgi:dolichol-phosphate mannosyltransferase
VDGARPADVMIGSRYIPGGGIEGWGLARRMMSRAVNFYSRWALGLAPKDCSGNFRCYRTGLLERLDFRAVRSRGYCFQEEILLRLARLGARFGETPIVFVNRRRGTSKIDFREAITAVWRIFTLAVERVLS